MVRSGDLFGDGVNIAARLQSVAKPGGVCISGATYDQVRKVLPMTFVDLGVQQVKNIQEPIRAYQVGAPSETREAAPAYLAETENAPPLPDKPSIAVLPFQNMSGDPEQEYFADGMVEEIITALSRLHRSGKWFPLRKLATQEQCRSDTSATVHKIHCGRSPLKSDVEGGPHSNDDTPLGGGCPRHPGGGSPSSPRQPKKSRPDRGPLVDR
jgi:hypothetical protein